MNKTVNLNIRLTEEERDSMRRDAHQHDMTVSAYLRWLANREHEHLVEEEAYMNTPNKSLCSLYMRLLHGDFGEEKKK